MIPTRLFEFIEFQKDNVPLEKAFSTKNKGTWESLSTSDFIDKSSGISRAFIGKGIKAGDKITNGFSFKKFKKKQNMNFKKFVM